MMKKLGMKKSRIKRAVLQILSLLMVTAGLYGCSGDGKVVSNPEGGGGGQQKNQAMGRFTETEVPLPDGIAYDSVISFLNGPDGKPVLFVRKDVDGTAEFTGYLLSEDITWEEKTCGWLNQLGLSYEYGQVNITVGEDRKLYAVYSEDVSEDTIAQHHVVVSADWENGQEIQLPLLLETNEQGYVYYPRKITAMENGNLLLDSGRSIFLYDAEGQKRIAEYAGQNAYYFAHGSQFYIIDGESKSLVRYDGESGKETARIPAQLDDYYGVIAAENEAGDLSLVSKDGIQVMKNGSGIWEQIVEGERNTMGSPKYYQTGFVMGDKEDYFVFYSSMDETYKLSHYAYNADMPVEPETELTIFSLYENATIRQAVSEYQIKNPNVRVDYQPLMAQDGGAESGGTEAGGVNAGGTATADYIRTLNTELLAGNGPDILILDGLSENSYIEKGVLEDLTDVVESMTDSGDFLANIADGSRVDGRIYSVPVRIGLPITFGRKEALKEAGQLPSLVSLVQEHEVGQIFGTVDRERLVSFYADAFLDDMISGDGMVQEEALKAFLSNMKMILDGSKVSNGTRENRPTSIWGLLETGKYLHSEEIAGFFGAGSGVSIIEQAQGELEADMILVNQAYVPYGTIGINKAGKHKEAAVQFLQTALSEEVQRSDFYDGFPVNENALEFLCGIVRTSGEAYGGYINGTDGRTYEMKGVWPTEPLRRKLAEFCKEAKRSSGRNWKIKQILLEHSAGYFEGRTSLEETTEELLSKMTLYLQE